LAAPELEHHAVAVGGAHQHLQQRSPALHALDRERLIALPEHEIGGVGSPAPAREHEHPAVGECEQVLLARQEQQRDARSKLCGPAPALAGDVLTFDQDRPGRLLDALGALPTHAARLPARRGLAAAQPPPRAQRRPR
jgi:hypothetical protein